MFSRGTYYGLLFVRISSLGCTAIHCGLLEEGLLQLYPYIAILCQGLSFPLHSRRLEERRKSSHSHGNASSLASSAVQQLTSSLPPRFSSQISIVVECGRTWYISFKSLTTLTLPDLVLAGSLPAGKNRLFYYTLFNWSAYSRSRIRLPWEEPVS